MKGRLLLFFIVIWATMAVPAALAAPPSQDFPDVCQSGNNILPNCNFDQGLSPWVPYFESGSAFVEVQQGGDTCHAPLCPAVHIVAEGNFIGGIYQQVPVTPGAVYYANIVWLAFDSIVNDPGINQAVGGGIGRRIGIDPTGGTDPRSPNVVWSEDNWRNDCKICQVEHVTVTAQSDVITVFIRLDDTWRQRAAERGYSVPPSQDQFWLDDIGLMQVGEAAAPTPTPTPIPPTDTPTPPADTPTATPIPPTDTPTPPADTPTPGAPDQPTPTLTPTTGAKVIAPPPTLTPSPTRTPTPTLPPRPTFTPTRRPRPTPTPTLFSMGLTGVLGTSACVGSLVLLVLMILAGAAVWLYRLGRGTEDG